MLSYFPTVNQLNHLDPKVLMTLRNSLRIAPVHRRLRLRRRQGRLRHGRGRVLDRGRIAVGSHRRPQRTNVQGRLHCCSE